MKLAFTLIVAAALFSTSACNATPAQERNFEASEEAEESAGDEETLIGFICIGRSTRAPKAPPRADVADVLTLWKGAVED